MEYESSETMREISVDSINFIFLVDRLDTFLNLLELIKCKNLYSWRKGMRYVLVKNWKIYQAI